MVDAARRDLEAPRSLLLRPGERRIHGVPLDESLRDFCGPTDDETGQPRGVRTGLTRRASARAIA